MDNKSLEILEFPHIKQILAGFTSFSASRQLALDLQPAGNHEQVALLLRQSAEARHLLDIDASFSIGGVQDLRQDVKMAAAGKMLAPQSLLEIQNTLTAMGQVRKSLKRLSPQLPLLWGIASNLVELDDVIRHLARCLAPDGEVLDRASANLAGIRQQSRELRQRLREKLEAIMNTSRGRKVIQEPLITEREGRQVIPVKIEHRKEIRGIVHDVSNTSATVFVEPWVTVELGNTIREVTAEERHEVERILRDLSARVGEHAAEISNSIALLAELDLLLAKARYAYKLSAVEPALASFGDGQEPSAGEPSGRLKLMAARHPLLGDTAVPLSLEIGRDFSVLIITGPNTGGKTVALKTLGLLSLMTQSGIPIPASADSQIPVFDNIFADIGDEQSIAQTLSTFSWHVGNIVRIINLATKKSLVLLDELGTSTDPVEGSALAVSILHHFLGRGTMTVATTHFAEVKAFAHSTAGMQNASFDFDPVTLTPTYHLTIGTPSGSNALAVATRLGLPREIIAEAETLVPEGMRQLETLLVSLKTKEQEITTLQRRLEMETNDAVQRRTELETLLQQSKVDVRNLIEQARDRVTLEVAELRKQMREAASELRKEKSRERLEEARRTVAAVQEQLKSKALQTENDAAPGEKAPESTQLAAGDTVWIREVGLKGTVLSVSQGTHEVEVQAGQTRLRLGLDKVEKVILPEGQTVAEITTVRMATVPRAPVSRELDLRGKRADEIETLLDKYLNDASVANQREVRIIHGFGTGVVRQIVRDSLATHPLVKSFRAGQRGEGGDGVTIAQL